MHFGVQHVTVSMHWQTRHVGCSMMCADVQPPCCQVPSPTTHSLQHTLLMLLGVAKRLVQQLTTPQQHESKSALQPGEGRVICSCSCRRALMSRGCPNSHAQLAARTHLCCWVLQSTS